jgi:hypothetical protein
VKVAALLEVHVRVAELPSWIEVWLAESVHCGDAGGGGVLVTTTVPEQTTVVPLALVATPV